MDERRHTFWIDANSRPSLDSSFKEIACKIGNNSFADVKEWLKDKSHGRWIMVVDGVGSPELAKKIKTLLPASENEQILATARNRESLVEIGIWENQEIKPPGPKDSYKILQLYLNPEYDDEDLENNNELLEKLWLPVVIEMAAEYMNKKGILSRSMREDLESYNFKQIIQFSLGQHTAFMNYFLEPITYIKNDKINLKVELRLLCFLACFSNKAIELKLIQTYYQDHMNLNDKLLTLVNCAFIEKVSDDEFRMHKFIQDGVIEWIQNRRGQKRFFKGLSRVLGALYQSYIINTDENKPREGFPPLIHSRNGLKMPFMKHFIRFVELMRAARKETPERSVFCNESLWGIEKFSREFIDDGYSSEAIEVLHFVLNHSGTKSAKNNATNGSNPQNPLTGGLVRTFLEKTLAMAYSQRRDPGDFELAKKLLNKQFELLSDFQNNCGTRTERINYKILKWVVQLDLVQLYERFNQLSCADGELGHLRCLDVELGRNGYQPRYPEFLEIFKDMDRRMQKQAWHLVVRHQSLEGRLGLGHGKQLIRRPQLRFSHLRARIVWKCARFSISRAVGILKQWLPKEEEYLMKMEGIAVDLDVELGAVLKPKKAEKYLRAAEEILTRHRQTLIEKQDEYQLWETELKLAKVRVERKTQPSQSDVDDLKRLMENYQTRCGEKNTKTRGCARVLAAAYMKQGLINDAQQLLRKYDLPAVKTTLSERKVK